MKLTAHSIKELIQVLGFEPEDNKGDIYFKQYTNHNNYIIKIDFNNEKIEYRKTDVSKENGIKSGDSTGSDFENSKSLVVLECVDRLLTKGYSPESLSLEHKCIMGKTEKERLDILISDHDKKSYLMIECRAWGNEYEKERKKMLKDGGKLFSCYINDQDAKYLCIYSSHLNEGSIEYRNDIVPVDEVWAQLANVKEIHDHWNKNFKDNGIFDEWSTSYNIKTKALVCGQLKSLTEEDSGRIFNHFAEILRHNIISDKPNAFNKILNLFICKIYDENKSDEEEVEFQIKENEKDEDLQVRLNDLFLKGMKQFLGIEVADVSTEDFLKELKRVNIDKPSDDLMKKFIDLRLKKNPEFAFIEVYDEKSFKKNARVLREVIELLEPYKFRYSHKQPFLGNFFELLLNTSIKQEAGQFFTPIPIAHFIVSSLPIKEKIEENIANCNAQALPYVIDYACGAGHFLTEYMDICQKTIEKIDISNAIPKTKKEISAWREHSPFKWVKEYVYGIEADYRLVKTSKVSCFLNGDGDANIIIANGLDHFINSKDYKDKLKLTAENNIEDNAQFDILIANPPYSVSAFKSTIKYGKDSFGLFQRLTDNSSEIECLFIERMKQLLKTGGYAGVILPSSILSNTGIYTSAREILLKHFKIIAITEFGPNTFMATGTNTVTLFLERRNDNDHEQIYNVINNFFEVPQDRTILGIENVFSKYVEEIFGEIAFEDYVSFIDKKPTARFAELELFRDYRNWFDKLTEIKKLKESEAFKKITAIEQETELEMLFYSKVFEIEKEKMFYFLLTYLQKTVVVKVGEKQAEKEFLGYEFSNRRGHEGIKMLPGGTKLYDENDELNFEKANSYIYKAFLDDIPPISENMMDNISVVDTYSLIDFSKTIFEKDINLNVKEKLKLKTKYPLMRLKAICHDIINGSTPPKNINKYWSTHDIPWLTMLDLDNKNMKINSTSQYVSQIAVNENKVKLIPVNSVLISCTATIGKVAINTIPLTTNQQINAIICKDDMIIPFYLGYFLRYYSKYLIYLTNNSGVSHVNLHMLKHFNIPVPPLDIQEKIVAEIETLEMLEKINEEKIEACRSNLLKSDYFSFRTERIEKLATMIQRGKSANYGTSNIQIIKSGQARGYTEFDFSKKHFVSAEFVSDERNLRKGDILINSTGVGTAGRVTLFDLDGDFVVDSHITIIRLDQMKALPKYVLYAFVNIGFKNIEKMAKGQSGQIEISLNAVKNMRIPLPNIEKQKEIVSKIEVIESQIQNFKAEIISVKDRKEQVLSKYL